MGNSEDKHYNKKSQYFHLKSLFHVKQRENILLKRHNILMFMGGRHFA